MITLKNIPNITTYNFNIECSDNGYPIGITTKSFYITIKPMIQNPYNITFINKNNKQINTIIGSVSGFSNYPFIFSINNSQSFDIENTQCDLNNTIYFCYTNIIITDYFDNTYLLITATNPYNINTYYTIFLDKFEITTTTSTTTTSTTTTSTTIPTITITTIPMITTKSTYLTTYYETTKFTSVAPTYAVINNNSNLITTSKIIGITIGIVIFIIIMFVLIRKSRNSQSTKITINSLLTDDDIVLINNHIKSVNNPLYEWYKPDLVIDENNIYDYVPTNSFVVIDSTSIPEWYRNMNHHTLYINVDGNIIKHNIIYDNKKYKLENEDSYYNNLYEIVIHYNDYYQKLSIYDNHLIKNDPLNDDNHNPLNDDNQHNPLNDDNHNPLNDDNQHNPVNDNQIKHDILINETYQ
jgi:hypothetical protein